MPFTPPQYFGIARTQRHCGWVANSPDGNSGCVPDQLPAQYRIDILIEQEARHGCSAP
jgi:hypothetical protein